MNLSVLPAVTATFGVAAVGVVMGLAWSGGVRSDMRRVAAAAAAVLLLVCLVDLLPESKADLSWGPFLLSVLFGGAIAWVGANRLALKAPCCDADAGLTIVGDRVVLVAIGLHCLLDGLGLAASGLMAHHADWLFAAGLCLHKLPEGFLLAALFLASGVSSLKAGLASLGLEATTLVGALAGSQAGSLLDPPLVAVWTAMTAGIFLMLSAVALMPILRHQRHPGPKALG